MLDVGGGTGSYEPTDREVTAVEPSAVMLEQRPEGSARALQASAERLPFADRSFDAVMAILSDHHWRDRAAGLREVRRVARDRVLLFNADPVEVCRYWMSAEYLTGVRDLIPEAYLEPGFWAEELRHELGPLRLEPFPIPHDCRDGFYGAFWRRPDAYLDPAVRSGISIFPRLDPGEVADALARLRNDLEGGRWQERHHELLEAPELDLGYRIVVSPGSGSR